MLFGWRDPDEKRVRNMVATVFSENGNVSVFDIDQLAKGNVALAHGNSWRGDDFEDELRHAIYEWDRMPATWRTESQVLSAALKAGEVTRIPLDAPDV